MHHLIIYCIKNSYEKKVCSIPSWLNNLPAFINNRKAPKQREYIEELLRVSRCDTLESYLDITHILSLIDTF